MSRHHANGPVRDSSAQVALLAITYFVQEMVIRLGIATVFSVRWRIDFGRAPAQCLNVGEIFAAGAWQDGGP